MLVASTRERVVAWAVLFCFLAIISLISWYVWRSRHHGKLAMGFFIMTLLVSALIIPSIRNEYIHVSESALTIETGSWYKPSITILQMSDIKNIRENDQGRIIPANLIGDPGIDWHLTWHDGETQIFRLNDFFNAHRMVVAYYYKDRGFWLERLEDQARSSL
jgi:hypothetical protein